VFSEPGRLILDRAGQGPLPFGGGIHYCLGAPLARALGAYPALSYAGAGSCGRVTGTTVSSSPSPE
jgi:hypothetical protein